MWVLPGLLCKQCKQTTPHELHLQPLIDLRMRRTVFVLARVHITRLDSLGRLRSCLRGYSEPEAFLRRKTRSCRTWTSLVTRLMFRKTRSNSNSGISWRQTVSCVCGRRESKGEVPSYRHQARQNERAPERSCKGVPFSAWFGCRWNRREGLLVKERQLHCQTVRKSAGLQSGHFIFNVDKVEWTIECGVAYR